MLQKFQLSLYTSLPFVAAPSECISGGISFREGASWYDNCGRHCSCQQGREMCSILTCSQCTKNCCPTCPGEWIKKHFIHSFSLFIIHYSLFIFSFCIDHFSRFTLYIIFISFIYFSSYLLFLFRINFIWSLSCLRFIFTSLIHDSYLLLLFTIHIYFSYSRFIIHIPLNSNAVHISDITQICG